MGEEKLSVSDRNSRYLLVFSFISVVCIVLSKSIELLQNELSKIYITQSGIPYIKMLQAFPSIIFVSCIFLLVVLIRYSYFEANVFIERANASSQQVLLQKANSSYDHIFYYLMIFGIGIPFYLLFGSLIDNIEIAKNNYAITYSIVVVMSIIITIVTTRITSKKRGNAIPHISTDVVGAVVFLVCCLNAVTTFLPQQTNASLKIEYDNQYININLEGNSTFEKILIMVNNKIVEQIDGKEEDYFISKYVDKDNSINSTNKSLEADVFVEENNNYFYYTKTSDINEYVIEGMNDVQFILEIDGRNYMFSNPLIIEDSKYEYAKSIYETNINIRK